VNLPPVLAARWQTLAGRIDALTPRERVLILGAAVAVLWGIGVLGVLQPLWQRNANLAQEIARERIEAGRLDARIEESRRIAAADPDQGTRERIGGLRKELAQLDAAFAALEKTLVQPRQMVALLERVLRQGDGRVRILSLRSLGAAPLVEAPPRPAGAVQPGAAPAAADPVPGAPLHRHGVEIRLTGNYLDLLQYLVELERLPLRMYFSRALLDATDPAALTLTMSIYTLSIGREWLSI
jgi:MSHA biogenesis protein MshJ